MQVSDDFTLPRVYQHKTFAQRTDPPAQLVATSYGDITHKISPVYFRLSVNHEGLIIKDAVGRSGISTILDRLCSLKPEEVKASEIKCRIMTYGDRAQDVSLQGEDKEAFIRTFELAECFYWKLW